MKKPSVLIAAIVAVVGLGAAVAVGKETIEVGTSVSLTFASDLSGPRPDSFQGEVKAKKKGCEKGRRVDVRGVPWTLVGTDKTNNRGRYKIFFSELSLEGGRRFIAKARERLITKDNGDTIVCSPSFSNKEFIPVQP